MAWNELRSTFVNLLDQAQAGSVNLEFIRAWWRAEIIVQIWEGSISEVGEESAATLDPYLSGFDTEASAYRDQFWRDILLYSDFPGTSRGRSVPASGITNSGYTQESAAIVEGLRRMERDARWDLWSVGQTWDSLLKPPYSGHRANVSFTERGSVA